jgi:hypothetical protein
MFKGCVSYRALGLLALVTGLWLLAPTPAGTAAPEVPLRTPEPLPSARALAPIYAPRPVMPRVIKGTPLPVWRPSEAMETRPLRAPMPGAYRPMRPVGADLDSRWRVLTPAEEPIVGPWQLPRFALQAWGRVFSPVFQERYPFGAIDLRPQTLQRFEGGVGLVSPEGWRTDLALGYMGFAIADRQVTDSRHQRDDFTFALSGGRQVKLGPVATLLEAGYWMRYIGVANTLPPPATARLLTSPFQLFHGPALRTTFGGSLGGAWQVAARVEGRPYLLAHGDEAVLGIGPLFGYAAEPVVTWEPLFGTLLSAGYRFEQLSSYRADFTQSMQGPFIECPRKF